MQESSNMESNDPIPRYICVPSVHYLQWVSSAYSICQPQLLHVVQSCIGLEQLIYLYAKVSQYTN